jgi:hypothetical protein
MNKSFVFLIGAVLGAGAYHVYVADKKSEGALVDSLRLKNVA